MICKRAKVKAGSTTHGHGRFKIVQNLYFYMFLNLSKSQDLKYMAVEVLRISLCVSTYLPIYTHPHTQVFFILIILHGIPLGQTRLTFQITGDK